MEPRRDGAVLSYDQAPPLSVPMRFFLAAPCFGVAAGLFLALAGPASFGSPYAGPTVAAVHLYTAGFMLQAMFGALLQILPVAVGSAVPHALRVARAVHPPAVAGTAALAFGMSGGHGPWLDAATVALGLAVGAFLTGILPALRMGRARSPTRTAMRLAAAALGIAVALGATMAAALAGHLPIDPLAWLPRHALWGLVGWATMLVIAVAYLVVPMFEMTPPLPDRLQRALPWILIASVTVGSAGGSTRAATASAAPAAALISVALWRQFDRRRRRPNRDGTRYWRLAAGSLGAGALAAPVAAWGAVPGLWWCCGALLLHGFFGSLIMVMLYRIVPFLLWLHGQRAGMRRPSELGAIAPAVHDVQFALHAAALGLLAVAPWAGTLQAAGAALVASHGWCLWTHGRRLRAWVLARAAVGPHP
jgi:hypothetical protein